MASNMLQRMPLPRKAPTPHVCCIIPPALLLDILSANEASAGTRAAVQKTYNHCCKLQSRRKTRQVTSAQPRRGLSATGGQSLPQPQRSIIPPGVFHGTAVSSEATPEQQQHAQHSTQINQDVRSARADKATATAVAATTPDADGLYRKIYSSVQTDTLRKKLLYQEGGDVAAFSSDQGAQEILDFFGKTYQFYKDVFGRSSIDGNNLQLIGSLHYDDVPGPPGMDNAFWDGDEMAFGDGDGEMFGAFTKSIDVIGHELTHGVVQHTANLEYEFQSGALNESMADVFGSMIKQYFAAGGRQTAAEADWLIGEGIFLPSVAHAAALRSMKAPGTAYDNPKVGKDRQPADMDGYVDSANTDAGDWGGVHLNSGIPNRAFYLAATAIGGYSWEKAGKVWYAALGDQSLVGIDTRKAFAIFADLTVQHATTLFDAGVAEKVKEAWTDVKVYEARQPKYELKL
ncbi:hypothetical protein PZA11_001892 [Diplocarpon coronariae]